MVFRYIDPVPLGPFSGVTQKQCKACSTCPAGTYIETQCTAWEQTKCKSCAHQTCPPDRYRLGVCSGETNGYTCTACKAGTQVNNDTTGCVPCPRGFMGQAGSECTACPHGTFQDGTGQEVCKVCPNILVFEVDQPVVPEYGFNLCPSLIYVSTLNSQACKTTRSCTAGTYESVAVRDLGGVRRACPCWRVR